MGSILTVRDDDTGEEEQIDPGKMVAVVEEHRGLIQFFLDWEAGAFTMSKREYESLPAAIVDARRVFNSVRRETRVNQGG